MSSNNRMLSRVDAYVGRRFMGEQDFVFVVVDYFGRVDCVCAGRAIAECVAATLPGGSVKRFPLLFADQVIGFDEEALE